jgi:hypothetical protein
MSWFKSDEQKSYEERAKRHAQVARSYDEEAASLLERLKHRPEPVRQCALSLLKDERYLFDFPAWGDPNLNERLYCNEMDSFLKDPVLSRKLFQQELITLLDMVPFPSETTEASPFTTPLFSFIPDLRGFTERIHDWLKDASIVTKPCMFRAESARMNANVMRLHGEPTKISTSTIDPRAYFEGMKLGALLQTLVPLPLSHNDRFSHMHILGGTGAGKTTLLENLILHDLKSENRPALVIVDSQGDLIRKISRLALFNEELADALVLISPKDTKHPPALNVFDVNRERLGTYDDMLKEQVVAGVIQTFDYLFAGLLGADLTAKQGVFFKFVARLMLSLPETMGRNATILDMLRLMEDPAPYRKAIESLPPIQRDFFERDFQNKTFAQTKEQIRYRLHALIENPTLARLFTSPKTNVDLFSELNRGSVILVDTAKDFLKGSSAHFGQIFISLVLQAVLERAAITDRRPAFLIVDEAAEYFDSNIDDLLTQVRKFGMGCVFAHQYLDQCSGALKASLAANTSIKFAAGVSTSDARVMAAEMRTTPDFILSQPRLHFAAHIRNLTPQALSIPVQIGMLDKEPQLTKEQYQALIERNRARVFAAPSPTKPVEVEKDVSDEW